MVKKTAKVVLLGDGAVGKTSLVRRFVEQKFDDKYITTIGANVKKKQLEDPDINLMIWDLYGQKLNTNLQASNYSGADGALIVYDLTRRNTFNNLNEWLSHLFDVTGKIPFTILGNKYDLLEDFLESVDIDEITNEKFDEFMMDRHEEVIGYYKEVYDRVPDFNAVPLEELGRWAEEKKKELDIDFDYYKTSAKTGENVEKAFRSIARSIVEG